MQPYPSPSYMQRDPVLEHHKIVLRSDELTAADEAVKAAKGKGADTMKAALNGQKAARAPTLARCNEVLNRRLAGKSTTCRGASRSIQQYCVKAGAAFIALYLVIKAERAPSILSKHAAFRA